MDAGKSFRKSSFSSSQNLCVELAVEAHQTTIRDAKRPAVDALVVGARHFTALLSAIKHGDLNQPR
jgi:Domain of unknown function (DUF397)